MTIVWRGTKSELLIRLKGLASALAGEGKDRSEVVRRFSIVIGIAMLANVKEAFDVKSKGGTDAMGIKWQPLAPSTIAQRRVGHKDLENAEIKERQKIVKREEKKRLKVLSSLLPQPYAKREAKRYAERIATKLTGKNKVDTLGFRHVEILKDTGNMARSLEPGVFTGYSYKKPIGEGTENQIFDIQPGTVSVGSKDKKVLWHDEGRPEQGLPQRRIFPESAEHIPQFWWDDVIFAGTLYLKTEGLETWVDY